MKRNRYIMYAIGLMQGMVFYAPISTLYRQVQGVSIFQITIIESISLILCILLELPWGIIADKIGYRKTLIFCCWLYLLSKIIFWQATGFLWFLIERILLSFVLSGFSGVDTSILYLSSPKNTSQKVFGIYNSIQIAGLLLASCIFALFVKNNYQLAGFLTVVSYAIAAFLALCLVEVTQTKSNQTCIKEFQIILKTTWNNRTLFLFLIAVALLSEVHQTITVFLNQLQYKKCGLTSSSIGYIYIIATFIAIFGRYSSYLTKKLGVKLSLILLSGLAILSCFTLALTQSALLSVVSVLTLCLSNSLFQPFQMEMQHRQIHTQNRATALSIHTIVIDSIAAMTNLVFGTLSEHNLNMAFAFGTFLSGISLSLLLLWYKHTIVE